MSGLGQRLGLGMGLGLDQEQGRGWGCFWVWDWGFGRCGTRSRVFPPPCPLLPLGPVLPWGHLSQCRQEGPGPQGARGALEAQQLHLALGLPGRQGAWLTGRGRKGAPVCREKPLQTDRPCLPFPSVQWAQSKALCPWASCPFLVSTWRGSPVLWHKRLTGPFLLRGMCRLPSS